MASIHSYERNGKTFYEARVYVGRDDLTNRPRYKHKRNFSSKKEATLWASRLTLDAESDDLANRKNMKFDRVYKEWYAAYINITRESTNAKTAAVFDNHILPYFGRRRVGDITQANLQATVNQWAAEVSRNYKRWFGYVSDVLEYAVKQHYIASNPADRVTVPKRQPKAGDAPENFWDRRELATFFSCIDEQTEPEKYCLFRVLAYAGVRRGECLALTWGDVDFTAGAIRINKTLTQGNKGRQIVQAPKTAAGRRTVPMDASSMRSLKRWRILQMKQYLGRGMNINHPAQLVFATRNNTHKYLNQPEKWLKKIEDDNHITHRITVHGFRHTHASALFAAGASIKAVQTRLGHADVQTTLGIYTHVTDEQSVDAADKVANYLDF